jgi:hypothetical protein
MPGILRFKYLVTPCNIPVLLKKGYICQSLKPDPEKLITLFKR